MPRTATQDRATPGSDLSGVAGPYRTGSISRFPQDIARFINAGGPKAINPSFSRS